MNISELSANENIKVRPAKIVAGLEADKTNEFLQAIGKAIERKIDSAEAIAAIKDGTTTVPTKTVKPAKPAGKLKTDKSKEVAPTGPTTKKSTIDGNKKSETKTKSNKTDAKNSTENKKTKPTKQRSVSKDDGQSTTKAIEEPTKHAQIAPVEPENVVKDDKKEAISVSRKPRIYF